MTQEKELQTICKFCREVNRITHLKEDKRVKDYYKDKGTGDMHVVYVCPNCDSTINGVVFYD